MNTKSGYCLLTSTLSKTMDGATVKAMLSVSLRTVRDEVMKKRDDELE